MRRLTERKKRSRNKKIVMISSLCLLLCLCVGYAAFSTQLSLRAKGNIKEKKAADQLLENVVDSGDGLYKDEYENGRYIYKGANPNNYITFNNETWRIISVENDGTIKIMRNESIGNQVWDADNSNAWETSDIKTYLNGEYLSSITTNQDKIISHTWSIGGVEWNNSDLAGQIAAENGSQSQSASVGMITVSEYLRANTNLEQCGSFSLNNTNYSTCKTTNWIFNIVPSGGRLWTISPHTSFGLFVFDVDGATSDPGLVSYFNVFNSIGVSPAVYLTSDITLTGEGTEDNPYVIEEDGTSESSSRPSGGDSHRDEEGPSTGGDGDGWGDLEGEIAGSEDCEDCVTVDMSDEQEVE